MISGPPTDLGRELDEGADEKNDICLTDKKEGGVITKTMSARSGADCKRQVKQRLCCLIVRMHVLSLR